MVLSSVPVPVQESKVEDTIPPSLTQIVEGFKQTSVSPVTALRLVTTMIHSDGKVMPGEVKYLLYLIEALQLTEEEKEVVRHDFVNPLPLEELGQKLELPKEKSGENLLIDLLSVIANSDGELAKEETHLLNQIKQIFKENLKK